MSLNLSLQLNQTAKEFPAAVLTGPSSPFLHNAFSIAKELTGSTAQPVDKLGGGQLTLTAGAGSINLAAVAGLGGSVNMTGQRVQFAFFRNKSTNASPMTITVGASNGYDLLGASMNFTLKPGQWVFIDGNELTPDVAAADRTLDVAGTGSEVLEYQIISG